MVPVAPRTDRKNQRIGAVAGRQALTEISCRPARPGPADGDGGSVMSLNALADSRVRCIRKLLPKLKLKYPTDIEMADLAGLARVRDPADFAQHLKSIILDAHLNDARLRKVSILKVRKSLKKIATGAEELAKT